MIYTIGYQKQSLAGLVALVRGLNATLIDVRYSPRSKRAEFNASSLAAELGRGAGGYLYSGQTLGGFGKVTPAGIASLRPFDGEQQSNCVLMCMEHYPGDCHRHFAITGPHFRDALHIFDGHLFASGDIAEAEAGGEDAQPVGEVAALLSARF
jgi:uncharacterized protein (DUF488 family)